MKNRKKQVLFFVITTVPGPKRTGFFFFSPFNFSSPSRLTRREVLRLMGQTPITSKMFRPEGRTRAAPRAVRAVVLFPSPYLSASRPSPRVCQVCVPRPVLVS